MAHPQQTSLSICIVNYNSTRDELCSAIYSLQQSVRALQLSIPQSSISFYLVDNSENSELGLHIFDENAAEFAQLKVASRLLRGYGNIGFGSGHNLVISEIQSTYHLIMNPDVVLEADCLAEGIQYLQQNLHTAIVSPYATGYDGQKQYLCKSYPALFTFLVRGFVPGRLKKLFAKRLAKFEMRHLSESEPGKSIPIVSGCFMLSRTEALQKVQGFDANFFLYFEDFDLSLRVGKIADISYVPRMRIRHAGGHAARKGIRHLKMFLQSAIYFFHKHGWQVFKQS